MDPSRTDTADNRPAVHRSAELLITAAGQCLQVGATMRLPVMGPSVDHLSVYASSVITAQRRRWGITMTAAADELIRLAEAMSAVWATQSLSQLWPKVAELGLLKQTAPLDPTPTPPQRRPDPELPTPNPVIAAPNPDDDTVWEWAALLYWAPAMVPGTQATEVLLNQLAAIATTLELARDAIDPQWAHEADVRKVIVRFEEWITGPASESGQQISAVTAAWRQQLADVRQSTRSQTLAYMARAQAMLDSADVDDTPDVAIVRAAFYEYRDFCTQLPLAVPAITPNPAGAR